jgi:uncharacterized membrane protein YfcA
MLWAAVPFIVVPGVVGAVVGARAGAHLPGRVLRFALAVLVIVLSVRVWVTVITGDTT